MAMRLALACAVSMLLLAGCMSSTVTVSGQGYASGSKSQTLDCNGTGSIAMGNQGTGRMSVTVTDGKDGTIFNDSDFGAGQGGRAQHLTGAPGEWTLRVSTGLGYAGQWAVTLTC